MRVLRFFSFFVIVLSIVGVIGFFVAREVLLFVATANLENSTKRMGLVAHSRSEYAQQCARKGATTSQSIDSVQLRFVSDTEYDIVVVCQYFANDPIFVSRHTLPLLVKKIPGEGGLIWDVGGRSGIQLTALGGNRTVILDGSEYLVSRGLHPVDGNKPEATCGGFGYMCCDSTTQLGTGPVLSSASDCPSACHQTCEARPVALRLYSDPPPDLQTKIVSGSPNTSITFFYTIDPGQAKSLSATIDFGDGERQTIEDNEGTFTHSYQCAQQFCEYKATIYGEDEFGRRSAITPVSTLTIHIQ